MRYSQRNDGRPAYLRHTDWQVGQGRILELGNRGHIMAIVNVTPDSFSDGGHYCDHSKAVAHALACIRDGAAVIDIGGESTRPGAQEVSAAQEQDRVIPVIEELAGKTDALISIDTYRADTTRLAMAAGASIINDVHGLQREPAIADVAAETGAGLCIMHTGRGRQSVSHHDVIEDQRAFFDTSLAIARAAGVELGRIVLDPGFGFAKDVDDNLALMARFSQLRDLRLPWLVGTSRKRFLGSVSGHDRPEDRDIATAATTCMLRLEGAAIFRVHNVAANRDALAVADAVIKAGAMGGWS